MPPWPISLRRRFAGTRHADQRLRDEAIDTGDERAVHQTLLVEVDVPVTRLWLALRLQISERARFEARTIGGKIMLGRNVDRHVLARLREQYGAIAHDLDAIGPFRLSVACERLVYGLDGLAQHRLIIATGDIAEDDPNRM